MTLLDKPSNSHLSRRSSVCLTNLLKSIGNFEDGGEILYTELWQVLTEVIIVEVFRTMLEKYTPCQY